jgi:hypothetical protein
MSLSLAFSLSLSLSLSLSHTHTHPSFPKLKYDAFFSFFHLKKLISKDQGTSRNKFNDEKCVAIFLPSTYFVSFPFWWE